MTETVSILDLLSLTRRMGRTLIDEDAGILRFDWSCSGVEITFEGTELHATFSAMPGLEADGLPDDASAPRRETWPWLGVYLDDEEAPIHRFQVSTPVESRLIFHADKPECHRIRIIKLTENIKTYLGLMGFEKIRGQFLPCHAPEKDLIEFVGDSITCGFGNLSDGRSQGFWPAEEDGWMAHGAMAARLLNMEAQCVCVSGITVCKRPHFPGLYGMNDLYAYTDRPVQDKLGHSLAQWDFARHPARVVVLNLGTNDMFAAALGADFDQEAALFCQQYHDMLTLIRRLNGPDTHMICALGSIQYYLFPEIARTVEDWRLEKNDHRVHTFRYKPIFPADGIGAAGHPSLLTQRKMAKEIAGFVRRVLRMPEAD